MPQPQKKLKTETPKKIEPPKDTWQQRLFKRTIGDPTGWVIIVAAFYFLIQLWIMVISRASLSDLF
ncbi:hypothetical protein GW756_04910 [bacterium]|nr:hypothetical protein [bacterium]NCQ55718.1 hypothetical protein [Candidatus Parcubacteria bacterium]NCS67667.1 hypothetical protein [Candidatus Peregrinibacteria bacterium]NCS96681.1 hypothetical protein [bacterium]